MTSVKANVDGVLRRFLLKGSGGGMPSFADLMNMVLPLCRDGSGIPAGSPDVSLVDIKYRDDEGDMITLSSDAELEMAIVLSNASNSLLRIDVTSRSSSTTATETSSRDGSAPDMGGSPFFPTESPSGAGFPPHVHHQNFGPGFGPPHRGSFGQHPHPAYGGFGHPPSGPSDDSPRRHGHGFRGARGGGRGGRGRGCGRFRGRGCGPSEPMGDSAVHLNYVCDGCSVGPIVGKRFSSKSKNDYDLCEACLDSGNFESCGPFEEVQLPTRGVPNGPGPKSSEQPCDTPAYHLGVLCDGCNMNPIEGARYKSISRDNFDLCEGCHASGEYSDVGDFLKIDQPCGGQFLQRLLQKGQRMAKQMGMIPGDDNSSRLKVGGRFVNDVTIFDGTEMSSGTPFTKIWRMRNNGTDKWPEATCLCLVGGDAISKHDSVPVGEAGPGEEVDVSVDMVAPSKPGRYVSYWRLTLPNGRRFGHRVWCQINVTNDPTSAPRGETPEGSAEASSEAGKSSVAANVSENVQTHPNPVVCDLIDAIVSISGRDADKEFLIALVNALEEVVDDGVTEMISRSSDDPVEDLKRVPPFIIIAAIDTARAVVRSTAPAGASVEEAVRNFVILNAECLRGARERGENLRSGFFRVFTNMGSSMSDVNRGGSSQCQETPSSSTEVGDDVPVNASADADVVVASTSGEDIAPPQENLSPEGSFENDEDEDEKLYSIARAEVPPAVVSVDSVNTGENSNSLGGDEHDPIFMLAEMGFCDEQRNLQLLVEHGGNLEGVVMALTRE